MNVGNTRIGLITLLLSAGRFDLLWRSDELCFWAGVLGNGEYSSRRVVQIGTRTVIQQA